MPTLVRPLATWIALTAVRAVFDHLDNLNECTFDLNYIKKCMHAHFKIDKNSSLRPAMLHHLYGAWDKPFFAGLSKMIAEGTKQFADIFE